MLTYYTYVIELICILNLLYQIFRMLNWQVNLWLKFFCRNSFFYEHPRSWCWNVEKWNERKKRNFQVFKHFIFKSECHHWNSFVKVRQFLLKLFFYSLNKRGENKSTFQNEQPTSWVWTPAPYTRWMLIVDCLYPTQSSWDPWMTISRWWVQEVKKQKHFL